MSDFTREDLRAAIHAAEVAGGIDAECPLTCNCGFNHAINPEKAMLKALEAALTSRAKREANRPVPGLTPLDMEKMIAGVMDWRGAGETARDPLDLPQRLLRRAARLRVRG